MPVVSYCHCAHVKITCSWPFITFKMLSFYSKNLANVFTLFYLQNDVLAVLNGLKFSVSYFTGVTSLRPFLSQTGIMSESPSKMHFGSFFHWHIYVYV